MSDARRRLVGYALIATAATSWGSWPLILGHAPIAASLQSAIMMIVTTFAALPVLAADRVARKATWREWLAIGWLGVGDAGNVFCFFAAYQRTTVAIAVLTHYLAPIFVALAAPFVLGERARAKTWIAVAVAFGGLVLLLEPWHGAASGIGAVLGAASAVFYASNVVVTKRIGGTFSGTEMMAFHGVVAVPLLFALVPREAYASATPSAIGVVALGALGPGAAAGLLFNWGLRRVPASHGAVLTLLEPFCAMVIAATFLGQPLGPLAIVGAMMILAGAFAVIDR